MGSGRTPIKLEVRLPGISFGVDDVASFFRRRSPSRGPFLLISRDCGLALDTGLQTHKGAEPVLWPAHGFGHQLWYFKASPHRGEFVITSVANGLVLDARIGNELGRQTVMWTYHGEPHQRWRLHATGDGAAFVVESVATGHVLDRPREAEAASKTRPVLWERHDEMNQQFLIAMPSGTELS